MTKYRKLTLLQEFKDWLYKTGKNKENVTASWFDFFKGLDEELNFKEPAPGFFCRSKPDFTTCLELLDTYKRERERERAATNRCWEKQTTKQYDKP